MDSDERLVEYGATCRPWNIKGEEHSRSMPGGNPGTIVPRSWRFVENASGLPTAMPYEFSYEPTEPNPQHAEAYSDFFTALGCLLIKHNLHNLFGLRALVNFDEKLDLEITVDRDNIMIPSEGWKEEQIIKACWIFRPDREMQRVKKCTNKLGRAHRTEHEKK